MPRSKQIPPWLWITLVLFGFIAIQIASRKSPEVRKPGPERGDIELTDSVLPDELAGWKKLKFVPPQKADQLPDGQFWWSFAWLYTNGKHTALVAFDQADWGGWHELTVCYKAAGWELKDREVKAIEEASGRNEVIASFEMIPGPRRSTVIWSLFDQSANVLDSPDVWTKPEAAPAKERAVSRFKYQISNEAAEKLKNAPTKVMQAQVFVEHSQPLTEQDLSQIQALHQACLSAFQDAYLQSLTNSSFQRGRERWEPSTLNQPQIDANQRE